MDVTMSQSTMPPKQQSQKTRMTQLNQLNQPQLPSVIRSSNRQKSTQQPPQQASLYHQQSKNVVGVDSNNKNHISSTIKKGTAPPSSYGSTTAIDKAHESLYAQPNVIGGNFYLSSNVASSQAPSTNRRGPEIIQQTTPLQFSNQQQPPGRLDDYFQQMQAQWGQNPTNANGNSSTSQLQASQQLRGLQQPNIIGANRSNSQAVRGTKGRAAIQGGSSESATTNTSMQQLQARLHMKQQHAGQKNVGNSSNSNPASGGVKQNNNGGRISRLPNHTQIACEYINAHVNRGSSSQDPPQSEQMVRTPLKTMKARQNRNRTTENQNSRTNHHQFLQQSSQQLHNEYATPAVGRHNQMLTGGLSVEKPGHAVNGGSAEMPNLKSLQQRIPNNITSSSNSNSHVNSRLQPINLTKQIYGATSTHQQKAAITSGSYIIEQQKHNNNAALQDSSDSSISPLLHGAPANVGLLYPPHPEKHSKSSQNAREKGANNPPSSQGYQSNKIPLLKVGIKGPGRQKIIPDQPSSKVHTEGNQMTPQSNMIENNVGEVNDELLVTFFDKSLIQKRLSQEEATYRHSLDDKQPNFHTQDSSILGDPTGALINENSRSDTNLLAPPGADDQTNQRHSIQSDKNNNHLRLLQKSSNHQLQSRGTNAYKHQNTVAQIKHQSLKNLATASVGSLKPHDADQSNAIVNNTNTNGSDIGDRASFNLETEPSKSTKFNQSMVLVNQPKNLHPQGLYIGGQKQRKSQKASISVHQQRDLQSSQNLNQSLQDESMDQGVGIGIGMEHDSSHLVSALNRSMLVQECDLSQTGLSQAALSGMIDLNNNVDSERLSSKSIGIQNHHSNAKFGFFKDQQQQQMHRAQASNHSVDTSPLTKTYNLKSKLTYKSKVNLKSFLLNTNEKKQSQLDSNNQSQIIKTTATQADRASQRSIVESTNAYIRAAQQQQEQNRMQYLQSAGTIQNSYAQNGLTEADIGPSRFDFLASSSLPYRGMMGSSNLVQGTPDQQHSSIQLQTSSNKLNQYMSGSQLQPLEQIHSYQNLHSMHQQHSEEQSLRKRGELDPNITLFQLRQEIHRVPHQQAQPSASQQQSIPPMPLPLSQYDIKSRQSDLSKNSMNLPSVGSKAHLKQQMQSESFQTNSYQTITLQRSEATTGSMAGGGNARQANFALSAEKTKTTNTNKKINNNQQSSFSNFYHEQNDSSLGVTNLVQQNNSLQTINPAESKPGDEMLYSNQKMRQGKQPRPDQNPFKKVPKLHVFNKSRRLKTSSASRQTAADQDKDENQTADQQQTITTGIGQLTNIQAANAAIKIKNNQPGLETNPTTLDITSQTSNVYGTIDQKSEKQFPSSNARGGGGILASAPSHYKQSLRHNNQQLILNQDSEEKYTHMDADRAQQIASAASPYLQNLAKINIPPRNDISVEKKSRPQTQEQSSSQASAKQLEDHFNIDGTKHLEELGRRHSKVSKGSRQLRQQLSESRQSNASSLNQEHNATAKFAVVTTESQAMQEAARHSFYGTQVVIKQNKGETTTLGNNGGISRMSKKNIVLSKGSNSSTQNQKSSSHNSGLPRSGKNVGGANALMSKKLAKLGGDQANLRNVIDMNQTFNVASYMQNQNSSATSKQIYGGNESNNISRKGAKQNRRSSDRVRKNTDSPGNNSVYNQSSVQKLSDHGSQERMTRNDSAQTPYFLPTPQRTDSNWGDQMRQQDSAQQLQSQHSKHFVQIQDALENLKSSDAIRMGLVHAAESVPQQKQQINKEFKNKIKIEQSSLSKDISTLRNNLNQLSKKNSSRVSENNSNRGDGGAKQPKTTPVEQPEDSQKRLEEALQQQASYADQREKLQSSNKAYRQSTKQSNSRGRQQLQQQALPKTIL